MKRVLLTATFPGCGERTEECNLLDESDPIYDAFGVVRMDAFDEMAKGGFVLFEDDEGLFVVEAQDVRSIEVLSENGNTV